MTKLRYYVNTCGKWVSHSSTDTRNFLVFNDPKAATAYFLKKPGRQIDVRGLTKNGRRVCYCWKYWNRGRIIEQQPKYLLGL